MLLEASRILAGFSPVLESPCASLFPPISKVKEVCYAIAIGVGKKAIEEGVSDAKWSEVASLVHEMIWEPTETS